MNCQDFENVTSDLARGLLLEADARREAERHAGTCADCAARLNAERALSAGLRALAAATAQSEAAPRVESKLLAAFRAQAASEAIRDASPVGALVGDEEFAVTSAPKFNAAPNVLPFAKPAAPKRWSWAKTAFAASCAAAAALALFMLVPPPGAQAPRPVAADRAASQPPRVIPQEGRRKDEPARPTETLESKTNEEVLTAAVPTPRESRAPRTATVRDGLVTTNATYHGGRSSQGRRGLPASPEEVVTEFFPLMQDARLGTEEGGHVVRVEVPRSALERFGLPMNVEQAGGRVKADVLLGHDGMARAIRFVR